jgi:hypothetical protein
MRKSSTYPRPGQRSWRKTAPIMMATPVTAIEKYSSPTPVSREFTIAKPSMPLTIVQPAGSDLKRKPILLTHWLSPTIISQLRRSIRFRLTCDVASLARPCQRTRKFSFARPLRNSARCLLPPPTDGRSAKFRGWTKGAVHSISELRWRVGFGWIAVALFVVPTVHCYRDCRDRELLRQLWHYWSCSS